MKNVYVMKIITTNIGFIAKITILVILGIRSYIEVLIIFCGCDWDLNGNICKHVIKVGMVVGKCVFGEHVSPNVSSVIIERPIFLVDLNEPVVLIPEIQAELHPSFESPDGNFSDHVDFPTMGQDNAMFEADEMRFFMS